MIFADREEAGRLLAERLAGGGSPAAPVLLALPRGGVPVAAPIAAALGVPIALLLVRKLGAPGQEELALGAVVAGDPPQRVLNDDIVTGLGVPAATLDAITARELAEIARRRALFPGAAPPSLAGRVAIVVDDGVATGATAAVALRAARQAGAAAVTLAVPVIAGEVAARFRAEGFAVEALLEPERLGAVGAFYGDFRQVEDSAVAALLAASTDR